MNERLIDYGDRGLVRVVPDARTLAEVAAALVREATIQAVQDRGLATIALSGGSTPKQMGLILREDPFRTSVPWGSTHIFWGDERWVPLEDPENNAGEALRGYLSAADIPHNQVHPFLTTGIPSDSAGAYESIIRSVVPGEPVPAFDLILLGMGDDGHTASLFPETDALTVTDRLVTDNVVTKLNATRLTFTVPLINAARRVAFLIAGSVKAERLAEVLDGPIEPNRLPSQLVKPRGGELTWLVDEAAAANLARNFG